MQAREDRLLLMLFEMAGSNKIRKYIAIRVDGWLKCCAHHPIKCFAFPGDDLIQNFRLLPFPQLTISFTAATTQIYTDSSAKFRTLTLFYVPAGNGLIPVKFLCSKQSLTV